MAWPPTNGSSASGGGQQYAEHTNGTDQHENIGTHRSTIGDGLGRVEVVGSCGYVKSTVRRRGWLQFKHQLACLEHAEELIRYPLAFDQLLARGRAKDEHGFIRRIIHRGAPHAHYLVERTRAVAGRRWRDVLQLHQAYDRGSLAYRVDRKPRRREKLSDFLVLPRCHGERRMKVRLAPLELDDAADLRGAAASIRRARGREFGQGDEHGVAGFWRRWTC